MDLLSNRVLEPFLSRIDGAIKRKAWELKVTNGEERERAKSCSGRTEWLEVEEDRYKGRKEV
jgi:hypothetical protein